MFATRMRGTSRRRLLSLALVGGIALGATAGSPEILALMGPAASSSTMPRPSVSATSAPSATSSTVSVRPLLAALVTRMSAQQTSAKASTTSARSALYSAAVSAWAPVPGHPSYAMHDFAGDRNSSIFGVCTWYAWYRHRALPLLKLGNAGSWPANARRLGLWVSSRPVRGATVIFAPGVQGASSLGHVGVVQRVLSHGWLMISEMNFFWNGGGWGRVDYRYVHVGQGVSFII